MADEKKRKQAGPVSLADLERQFQDDDALARAINSALQDADDVVSRPKPAAEKADTQARGDDGEPIEFDEEVLEELEEEDTPVDPPPEAPKPKAVQPSRPAAQPKQKAKARPAQGMQPVDEKAEPQIEPPPRVREAAGNESETYERLLRVMAEFENYKKRTAREQADFKRFAIEKMVVEFLPVMDNFERAIAHAETGSDGSALFDGVKMIQRQMRSILLKVGVRGFDSVGQRFDPAKHQAMQMKPSNKIEPGTVLEEFQRGYFLHDRLIRPALVVVSEAGASAADISGDLPELGSIDTGDLPTLGEDGEEIIAELEAIDDEDGGELIDDLEPLDGDADDEIDELEPLDDDSETKH